MSTTTTNEAKFHLGSGDAMTVPVAGKPAKGRLETIAGGESVEAVIHQQVLQEAGQGRFSHRAAPE